MPSAMQAHHFSLPAELTIYTAEDTRLALLAWLQALPEGPLPQCALLGRQVDEIDSAGLQLLGALTNSLAERGAALALRQPSAALCSAIATLGCQDWFGPAPDRERP